MKNLVLNNSKDIYAIPSQGCFYSPFNTSVGRMSHLLLINFEKDPDELYNIFELQEAIDDNGRNAFLVMAYCIDGTIDIYHQPSYPVCSEMTAESLECVTCFERPLADAKFAASTDYLVAGFSFEDKKGRKISVEVRESKRARKRPFFLMAPEGVVSRNPITSSIFTLYEMEFANRKHTEINILIDGVKRSPDKFPLPIKWTYNYYTRYSTNTFSVDWNNDVSGKMMSLVPGKCNLVMDDDVIYKLVDNDGHIEIRTIYTDNGVNMFGPTFYPPIPELACLKDNVTLNGKAKTGTDKSIGIIYGDYTIEKRGNTVKIRLIPNKGWRPKRKRWLLSLIYKFVKVLKEWPKGHEWTATITFDESNHPIMQSKWEKV